jgi:hypothetical protein
MESLPVRQRRSVEREEHVVSGQPGVLGRRVLFRMQKYDPLAARNGA